MGKEQRWEERNAYKALRRAVCAHGCRVVFSSDKDEANRIFSDTKKIVIGKGQGLRTTLYTLAHEFGHALDDVHTDEKMMKAALNGSLKTYGTTRLSTIAVARELVAWDLGEAYIPKHLRAEYRAMQNRCVKTYTDFYGWKQEAVVVFLKNYKKMLQRI